MSSKRLSFTALAAMTLMSACGGGGGSTESAATSITAPAPGTASASGTATAPTVTRVEGYYAGAVRSGTLTEEFRLLALENDQFYALSGNTDAQGVFRVVSLTEGMGSSANGSFSVTDARSFSNSGRVTAGSISAAFVPKTSINGTASSATGSSTFSGTAPGAAVLAYDTPVQLSSVVGAWLGTSLSGNSVNFSINAAGVLSATIAGCTYSGLVSPRASGKNVLDVSVTVGPAPCTSAGERFVGIGITSVLTNGNRQLVIAGTNTARTDGTVLFAQR